MTDSAGIKRAGTHGIGWCCVFLALDSVQAVFFGGAFQAIDSFLLGALVFGPAAAACLVWTVFANRRDLAHAAGRPGDLLGLNVTAAGAWLAYLQAIQMIEPAVAFTLFSGAIPLTTLVAGRRGWPVGSNSGAKLEGLGLVLVALGIGALALFTVLGWSGFVRGGAAGAVGGLLMAGAAGVLITFMLLYSHRLDRAGVGPVAQFGLRFPLYVLLAALGAWIGIDSKGPVPAGHLILVWLAGLVLLAFPIYAVQKAVSLTSTRTIAAFAALGPLCVFLLQMAEGRVAYAEATLLGLGIYSIGALLTAVGRAGDAAPATGQRVGTGVSPE